VTAFADIARALGLRVFERGWLSSNNVLFDVPGEPTTLVDTGYATHAEQTVALVASVLGQRATGPRGLDHVVNTHLHSDHCGGNAALAAAHPALRIHVPQVLVDSVNRWDQEVLTFQRTGQRCDRFVAHAGLQPGHPLVLGAHAWQVHAAPGHDPTAIMLFEPSQRVLIAGDALWEKRLAIIFPELEGAEGFASTSQVLDAIEALRPAWVIPGHGAPFDDVAGALQASRERLARFTADPAAHAHHAVRALLMFHMLEHQRRPMSELTEWLCNASVLKHAGPSSPEDAKAVVAGLVSQGVLHRSGADVVVA
jgi:glyoxylase-like metal-dependent hydrolase (beta-lactamase superfamily II)